MFTLALWLLLVLAEAGVQALVVSSVLLFRQLALSPGCWGGRAGPFLIVLFPLSYFQYSITPVFNLSSHLSCYLVSEDYSVP